MGMFSKETDQEKAARYVREADARIKAREAAEKAAGKPEEQIRSADPLATDPNSVLGRIKARRDLAADADTQVEGKKKGGIVKSKKARGVGCAQRGHGKGRVC